MSGKLLTLHPGSARPKSSNACRDCRLRIGWESGFWRCGMTGDYVTVVRRAFDDGRCPHFLSKPPREGWLYRLWRWLW